MSRTSLLVVAHGSRRTASNDEIRQLADNLRQHTVDHYHSVRCAFLELAEPSIPDGIQQCIDDGATTVIVVPYFLSAGRHVAEDIPREVATKQHEHPAISITIAPYIGAMPELLSVVLGAARANPD